MENQISIQFLPPEVIVHITTFLNAKDILMFSSSCSLLRELLNDDLIWKRVCKFKSLDYFKWSECKVIPGLVWKTNELSSLPELCTWRKFYVMETHLERNWKLGRYKSYEIGFGPSNGVFGGTLVKFYDNDHLFLHSKIITENTLLDEIWNVQDYPFLHSSLNLNLAQYVGEEVGEKVCLMHITESNKLVVSCKKLVLVFDINLSNYSQVPLHHAFVFDKSDKCLYDAMSDDLNEAGSKNVAFCNNFFVGATRTNKSDNVTLHFWNVDKGEKAKEECLTDSVFIDSYSLVYSENEKHIVIKLRVKKSRYMYHYYGYDTSKMEFSAFFVQVNYCDFDIISGNSVVGTGPRKLLLYSYKTSKKVASWSCNHEILKKTLTIVGGYLLCGTFENTIYVLDPKTLALCNTVQLQFTLYSLQAICNKFVVINVAKSEVWEIGKTAKKLFKLPTDGTFASVNHCGTKLALKKNNKLLILNFW